MFRIIRCGAYYELVIVVTPEYASLQTRDAKFYRYADWSIGDHQPEVFNEVSAEGAEGYFNGHADGMGWGEIPDYDFESFEAIMEWIEISQKKTEEDIDSKELEELRERIRQMEIKIQKQVLGKLRAGTYPDPKRAIDEIYSVVSRGIISLADIETTAEELGVLMFSGVELAKDRGGVETVSDEKAKIKSEVEKLKQENAEDIALLLKEDIEDWEKEMKLVLGDNINSEQIKLTAEKWSDIHILHGILCQKAKEAGEGDLSIESFSLEFRKAYQELSSVAYVAMGEVMGEENFEKFFDFSPKDIAIAMLNMMVQGDWIDEQ